MEREVLFWTTATWPHWSYGPPRGSSWPACPRLRPPSRRSERSARHSWILSRRKDSLTTTQVSCTYVCIHACIECALKFEVCIFDNMKACMYVFCMYMKYVWYYVLPGIRVALDGSRFRIDSAVVWNVLIDGQFLGQAATFPTWTSLPSGKWFTVNQPIDCSLCTYTI